MIRRAAIKNDSSRRTDLAGFQTEFAQRACLSRRREISGSRAVSVTLDWITSKVCTAVQPSQPLPVLNPVALIPRHCPDGHVVKPEKIDSRCRVTEGDASEGVSRVDEAEEKHSAARAVDRVWHRDRCRRPAKVGKRERYLTAEVTDVHTKEAKRGDGSTKRDRKNGAGVKILVAGNGITPKAVVATRHIGNLTCPSEGRRTRTYKP